MRTPNKEELGDKNWVKATGAIVILLCFMPLLFAVLIIWLLVLAMKRGIWPFLVIYNEGLYWCFKGYTNHLIESGWSED